MEERKRKKKPSKIEELTKEQIREAILKKRECNTKALSIVESLLEKGISEDHLIKCLPDINQSHFEDIVEERAITNICGYPICSKELSVREIPKQKYRISMKTNKVYDITVRKNFCSNRCYQAAMHVKMQMLTSPLWCREYEEIPRFNLLHFPEVGIMGQVVDLSLTKRVDVQTPVQPFTSVNEFTSASLKDITAEVECDDDGEKENVRNESITKDRKLCKRMCDLSIQDPLIDPPIPAQLTQPVDSISQSEIKMTNKNRKAPQNSLNIIGEIIERPGRSVDPILTETISNSAASETMEPVKLLKRQQPLVTVLTIQVEKCLADWFTIDTLLFLFGEDRVKEMVSNKGDCIKEYLNNYTKGIFYTSNSYDHYQAICRKLNMLELEDKQHDSETLNTELKPLPDYSILQEESKKMRLRVKAFYTADTEMPEVERSEEQTPSPEENGAEMTQLPLVDKHAQHALRRKIVCQQLNHVLPDLLQSLGVLAQSISSEVRLIVNSFKLNANNITFKPIQWTLIAIVLIKLLSLRDQRLEYLLEQPMAYKHMQLLLLSYKQDGCYLDRLISWLTDIDRLLDTNDLQLTID